MLVLQDCIHKLSDFKKMNATKYGASLSQEGSIGNIHSSCTVSVTPPRVLCPSIYFKEIMF